MRAEVEVRPVRERRFVRVRRGPPGILSAGRSAVLALALALVMVVAAGLGFAGSGNRIAAGVTVAGVEVAGLTSAEAERLLASRARELEAVPVTLAAGSERWRLRPRALEVRVDWQEAAAEARARSDWPLPVRGLRRVFLRLFAAEVTPEASVDRAALRREVSRLADAIDRPGRSAAIVLQALEPVVVPSEDGRALDRAEAATTIVRALASLERRPVPLPVRRRPPSVAADELEPVVEHVRLALSAPIRFGWRGVHWPVVPAQLAELLALPAGGTKALRVGGAEAERYFGFLARAVNRTPKDAGFAVSDSGAVRVMPGRSGRTLDVRASERALLAAALSDDVREASLAVRTVEPELTTARARSLGITRVLAAYTTAYSGSADRIHNLRLAVSLLDGTRLAPGETFSLNAVVGARTAARGFRAAPVIVDGEYAEGIGGGVSQVATTIFNAAWEAGLKVTARTAHALYISRYPLGRDATVNYPDIDLRFVNDTDGWVVVQGLSGDAGITIRLLGKPTGRSVVSEAGTLHPTGPPAVERIPDPTLEVGERVVVDPGEPSRAIAVTRTVYEGDAVLYAETWRTTYRSEPATVRVGTRPKPPAEPARPSGDEAKKKPPRSPPGGGATGGAEGSPGTAER